VLLSHAVAQLEAKKAKRKERKEDEEEEEEGGDEEESELESEPDELSDEEADEEEEAEGSSEEVEEEEDSEEALQRQIRRAEKENQASSPANSDEGTPLSLSLFLSPSFFPVHLFIFEVIKTMYDLFSQTRASRKFPRMPPSGYSTTVTATRKKKAPKAICKRFSVHSLPAETSARLLRRHPKRRRRKNTKPTRTLLLHLLQMAPRNKRSCFRASRSARSQRNKCVANLKKKIEQRSEGIRAAVTGPCEDFFPVPRAACIVVYSPSARDYSSIPPKVP
jgi:hypothetical protein